MKKMRLGRMGAVAVTMVLIMALAPAQTAFGGFKIKTITKTLPSNGANVTVTFKPAKDTIIYEVLVDTTPTLKDGLCTDSGDDVCYDCDIRIHSLTVDGSELLPKDEPQYGPPYREWGQNDKIAVRPLLGKGYSDIHLPLDAKKKLVLTLDTDNGNNDVKIKFTFLYEGGGTPVKLF